MEENRSNRNDDRFDLERTYCFSTNCPLVFSRCWECCFNISDIIISGGRAISDYRSTGGSWFGNASVVTLFTGFLIGMGCGVIVRMAHELGAGWGIRDQTVHSAFVICLIVSLP